MATNKLKVNPNMTEFILFGSKRLRDRLKAYMAGITLALLSSKMISISIGTQVLCLSFVHQYVAPNAQACAASGTVFLYLNFYSTILTLDWQSMSPPLQIF